MSTRSPRVALVRCERRTARGPVHRVDQVEGGIAAEVAADVARRLGLSGLSIAAITGDDVLDEVIAAELRGLRRRLETMAVEMPVSLIQPGEAWADRAIADLEAVPADVRNRWAVLLAHAVTACLSATPSTACSTMKRG